MKLNMLQIKQKTLMLTSAMINHMAKDYGIPWNCCYENLHKFIKTIKHPQDVFQMDLYIMHSKQTM